MLGWAAVVSLLVLGLTALAWQWLQRARARPTSKSIAVVVLGDLGRSPRMLYHAESLVARGWFVSLVGYEGALRTSSAAVRSEPSRLDRYALNIAQLTQCSDTPLEKALRERLVVRALGPLPAVLAKVPRQLFLLLAPIKLLWTAFALGRTIFSIDSPPRYILVQVSHRHLSGPADRSEPSRPAYAAHRAARLPAHRLAPRHRLAQHRRVDPRAAPGRASHRRPSRRLVRSGR